MGAGKKDSFESIRLCVKPFETNTEMKMKKGKKDISLPTGEKGLIVLW